MTVDPTQRDVQAAVAASSTPTLVFAGAGGKFRSGAILTNTTGDSGMPAAVDILIRIVPKGFAAVTSIAFSDRMYRIYSGDVFDLGQLGASDSDIYVVGAGGSAFSYVAEAKL